jgi:hypothetical protein
VYRGVASAQKDGMSISTNRSALTHRNTVHTCFFLLQEPDGGSMKGLAFAFDPDGYSLEIIKRGGIDFGDVKKE